MGRLDDLSRPAAERFGAAAEPGGAGEAANGRPVTEIRTLLDEFLVPHGWVRGVVHRVHGVHDNRKDLFASNSLQCDLCNIVSA